MVKKYLWNGFVKIGEYLSKHMPEYEFVFSFPKSWRGDWITNYQLIKKMIRTHEIDAYDIVHINNWEGILAYSKRRKDQIFVAHAHGFFVGVNFDRTIVELPFFRRNMSRVLKFMLDAKMKRKLKTADLFYCSTPNMLEHCKKIRPDAKWLPLPMNFKLCSPTGEKKKLEGNPAIFLPTRIHVFKNPIFGARLFDRIRMKYPSAKLHIIRYGRGADPLYDEFVGIVGKEHLIEHPLMPREELVKYYRGADLVLGQFNPNLGNLSLVELEAMACGAPIVTLDKFELDYPTEKLDSIAFRLIADKKYRLSYIKKNNSYVRKVHSEEAVAELHRKNLKEIMN